MTDAIIWGLVQGLTEFLPVSSSGHLVLVPAFLSRFGWEIAQPSLAISAVLHLGTLLAVVLYYRRDLVSLTRARTDPAARRLLGLLALGTVPALVGLPLKDSIDAFASSARNVAAALFVTGLVLLVGSRLLTGMRTWESGTWRDALVVGVFQAFALVPGISRSGMTITAAAGRRFDGTEAARFSFLLAVPAIAGGGLLSLLDVSSDTATGPLIVGLLVSAVSGYAAIAGLLRVLRRVGLGPFALYCLLVGVLGFVLL